jgi:choline-glycine betaine transporter
LVLILHIFTPLGCSRSRGCLGVLIAFKLVIAFELVIAFKLVITILLVAFTLLSLCSLSNSLYLCHILIAAAV